MEIRFYDKGAVERGRYEFAVICAAYRGRWVFVRNRERCTWEVPGGHREAGEDVDAAAGRELLEETGALAYEIEPLYDYSVTTGGTTSFGRLFYAKITGLGPLPESEICELSFLKELPGPDRLTYPEILPVLHKKVLEHLDGKLLAQLEKDKNRNINMVNFLRNYPAYSFDTAGASVLARGRSDEDWVYISSSSQEEFERLISGLDENDKCFAILEDWMLPYIVGHRTVKSRLTSMKLVYEDTMPLLSAVSAVVKLDASYSGYIYENSKYREYISIDYINERLANGTGLGIFTDGRLVAWALTHDDGAIGFLNVLEGYRQKGYGTDVTAAMINTLLENGEVPFVHIEETNAASMNLALKAGFVKDRRIHWIKLE